MEMRQARQRLHDGWEKCAGHRSGMVQGLSPRSIAIWRLIHALPERVASTLLDGVSARPGPEERREHAMALYQGLALAPPTISALLCLVLRAPAMYTGGWTLASAAAGEALSRKLERRAERRSEAAARAEMDDSAVEQALELSQRTLEELFTFLAEEERESGLGHDVTADPAFGLWVQKFVGHAKRHPEDLALAGLKEELYSRLEAMGVTVCDELPDGAEAAALPEADYFTGGSPETAHAEVVRAAVYSRRGLLARGELR